MPGDRMYAPTIVRRTDLAPRVNYPSRVLSRDSYGTCREYSLSPGDVVTVTHAGYFVQATWQPTDPEQRPAVSEAACSWPIFSDGFVGLVSSRQ